MTLTTWLTFSAAETVLCLSPGPAVLLVISLALTEGPGPGFRGALGILAINVAYFALSAAGVSAVILASGRLFSVLRWGGAIYLIWLGGRMLLLAGRRSAGGERSEPAASPRTPRMGALARGLLVQGSNPKAMLFFTAFLPQFIDPRSGVVGQVVLLGVTSLAIELMVLGAYVMASGRSRVWARRPRVAEWLERAGGAFLIAAGVGLARLRH